ncbi:unnamed protein product [Polarella glacialis]|uniref:Uncharacterized protein n=1 Tax=Polarella glacialis TaxID=89957 RepID=A0A813GAD9_POLGL|nr:unnamed protein product [Polarella glacialis]
MSETELPGGAAGMSEATCIDPYGGTIQGDAVIAEAANEIKFAGSTQTIAAAGKREVAKTHGGFHEADTPMEVEFSGLASNVTSRKKTDETSQDVKEHQLAMEGSKREACKLYEEVDWGDEESGGQDVPEQDAGVSSEGGATGDIASAKQAENAGFSVCCCFRRTVALD